MRFAIFAAALAAAPAAWALPPATHAYGLNNSLADELGGPALESLGGKLKSTSFVFPMGGGVSLTGGVVAATYSIEFRARLSLTGSRNAYYRLVDFQDRASDTGLYSYGGILDFYDAAGGAKAVFHANKWADITLTRDGISQMVTGYVNGKKQFAFADPSGLAVFTAVAGETVAHLFQDDLAAPDEDGAGALDHLRVFDTVLTAADALALAKGQLPPNVTSK